MPLKSAVVQTPSEAELKAIARACVATEAQATVDPETKKVRGQVRMHAIIAGYKAAALLVATLNNSPAAIREDLHKLAKEVADKVEEYSFK